MCIRDRLEGVQLFPGLQILGDDRVGQIAAGTGLVQQVDGRVGQVAVGDIPVSYTHLLWEKTIPEKHLY